MDAKLLAGKVLVPIDAVEPKERKECGVGASGPAALRREFSPKLPGDRAKMRPSLPVAR